MKNFQHLQDLEMGYWAHFRQALTMSYHALVSAFELCIHAVYPDVYVHSAGDRILRLASYIERHLSRADDID
jgi:hypothetical protein